jgi:polar amino acid transport system substrate-binding protein
MLQRKRFKQSLLALLILLVSNSGVAQTKLTICTDLNFWYPFTYIKHQEAVGLHIGIISTALRHLGMEPNFIAAPWQECLNHAKEGLVDAIATTSYQKDRALYLNYPEGAAMDLKSPWRVTQVGYVVVTSALNKKGKKNTYQFTGDFKSIPEPVRTNTLFRNT